MKKSKLINVLLPTTLALTTTGVVMPLASCGSSTPETPKIHATLTSDAEATLDEDNLATFTFKLDATYDDVDVLFKGDDSDLFEIVSISKSNENITVKIKFKSIVNEDSTFKFGLKIAAGDWSTTISDLAIKVLAKADQAVVNQINAILAISNKPATMSALITLLKKYDIDLESYSTSSDTCQWAWDSEKNVVFVLNNNEKVECGPAGYELNPYKVNIWKMVGSSDTSFKTRYSNNVNITKEKFSSDSQYSQYLRSSETFNNKKLTFKSGLDTGIHTGFELTFKKDETLTEEQPSAIINTNKSSLTVESDLNDIEHHGNLTTLTINELPEDGTYTEFGSVDATVVIKDGSLVAENGSDINSVLIESTEVAIEIKNSGDIGSVYVTKEVAEEGGKAADYIEYESEKAQQPEQPKNPIDTTVEQTFAAGTGSERSPYAINSKQQLFNCANEVNTATLSESKTLHFKLIADVDLKNQEWTPIGTVDHQFFGTFDGNGFTISNLKTSTTIGTWYSKVHGGGLFGWTNGTFNSKYTSIGDIWDGTTLDTTNIAESEYKTVIKNVKLSNVNITYPVTEQVPEVKAVGGIVGRAINTYVTNCQVTSGTIEANGHIGGIVGTSQSSICNECIAGSKENAEPLNIIAQEYNAAGILGSGDYKSYVPNSYTPASTNHAILGCITYGNCNVKIKTVNGGYAGGMIAYEDNVDSMVIDSCINNAKIEAIGTATENDKSGIAGIAPLASHIQLISKCENHGEILVDGDSTIENAAGIATYPNSSLQILNCKNYGKIAANAPNAKNYVCGIVSGCQEEGLTREQVHTVDCENHGELINSSERSTNVRQICDLDEQ